jgi:uncharacterized coiled-coil protein SlyX/uncharacterized protein YcbK (DUF882 family)
MEPVVDERIVGFEKRDGREIMVVERKGKRFGIPAENAKKFMDDTGLSYDASTGEKAIAALRGVEDVASFGFRDKIEGTKALTGPWAQGGEALARSIPVVGQVLGQAVGPAGRYLGAKIGGEDLEPYEVAKQKSAVEAASDEAKASGYATGGRVFTGLASGAAGGVATGAIGRGMQLAGATKTGAMMSSGIPAAVGESMLYTTGKTDLGDPDAAKDIAVSGALTGGIGLIGKKIGDTIPILRAARAKGRMEPLEQARDAAEDTLKNAKMAQAAALDRAKAASRALAAANEGADAAAIARAKQNVVRFQADADAVSPARIAELERELADANRALGVQKSAIELTRDRVAKKGAKAEAPPVEESIGKNDLDDLLNALDEAPPEVSEVFASRPARASPPVSALESVGSPSTGAGTVGGRPRPRPPAPPAPSMAAPESARAGLASTKAMLDGTAPWGPPPPELAAALSKRGLSWPDVRPPADKRGNVYRMAANVLDEDAGVELTRLPGMEPKPKLAFRGGGEGYPKAPPVNTATVRPTARAAEALDGGVPPTARPDEPTAVIGDDPTLIGRRRTPIDEQGLNPAPSRIQEMESELASQEAMVNRLRSDLAQQRAGLDKTQVGVRGDVAVLARNMESAEELGSLAAARKASAERSAREAMGTWEDTYNATKRAEEAVKAPRKAYADELDVSSESIESLGRWKEAVKELQNPNRTEKAGMNLVQFLAFGAVASGNPFMAAVGGAVAAGTAVRRWAPSAILPVLKTAGYLEPVLKTAAQASKSAGGPTPKAVMEEHRKRMASDPEYRAKMTDAAEELDEQVRDQEPQAMRRKPRKGESKSASTIADWYESRGRRVTSTVRSHGENKRTMGAAKNSEHLKGAAVDIGASDKSSPQAAVRDLTLAYAEMMSDPEVMKHVKTVVLEIPKGAKYANIELPEERGLVVKRRKVNGPHLHIETM